MVFASKSKLKGFRKTLLKKFYSARAIPKHLRAVREGLLLFLPKKTVVLCWLWFKTRALTVTNLDPVKITHVVGPKATIATERWRF